MGAITLPQKVRLISAMCYSDSTVKDLALAQCIEHFGPIADMSDSVDFSFTSYYEEEMGSNLKKIYFSFERLIDPINLSEIKIFTNNIEDEYAEHDHRLVNIDPGYIEAAKLILATTKNFSHRVYIGQGIYGDVQLYWKGGGFNFNPWTYPDYKTAYVKSFFEKIRIKYFNQIRGN